MSQIFLSPFAMPELDRVVEQLCAPSSLEGVFHRPLHDAPMPSLDVLGEILSRLKIALFPGYFGMSNVRMESMRYHLSANLDSIFRKLAEQIRCGACFACAEYAQECLECERISREKALEFIERLPHIRRLLATDARAAYQGDPAATSAGETIFCYPSILTMIHYRIAHELYLLEVPIIPRILCEMAHAITGIDIHPGASVGEAFFIDHGTGVVIGDVRHRQGMPLVSGGYARRAVLPQGGRRGAHQGHPPPSEAGGRRDRVRGRDHPRQHHHRGGIGHRREYMGHAGRAPQQ